MNLAADHINYFNSVCGNENVLTSQDVLIAYGHDETEDLNYPPQVVVKPATPQEVSEILKYCNAHKIPVTPIGARTGLSGGALSVHGGVGMSMEKFNKILNIDEKNLQVIVEPGVITQVLQEAVIDKNLFYPVDPSSRGSCFIGGNIAENSGGPRAVKYGVTKDYVLNLEVVLPTGEIVWTGANTLKNSTGYNLTQLMVGSEGTLGVITKIVLKLIPYPSQNVLMLVPFKSAVNACKAVSAVFRAGITPSAMEFMERDAIDWTLKYVDGINIKVEPHHMAHLLIEVDGFELEPLYLLAEKIVAIMQDYECDEVLFADTAEQKDQLWRMRRRVGEAVKSNSIYKEEDTVVPRYELPALLEGVKSIGARYGFKSVCYGHAGDGNLHINIIKGDLSDDVWKNELPKGITELFELTKKLGGTLSGEHGIGFVQKNYMPIVFDKVSLDIMKGIKKLFDPNGILNPGKIFPDV
ncbi:MAG TPA: FAD-linked oxidase C-terminal domain-containing protein [Flavobacteriales bacterium]|nr:FAD-linked oxidase C-terminal domain-containing protein [Flavobacteriales bacterium]